MNHTYIDQQQDFDELCHQLKGEAQLAVDTEFVRRNTYYPILALVQIASPSGIFLVDPQGVKDWSGLVSLFQTDTRIIMHSCSEDLEVFRNALGQLPENLFDTQIAAAYLGKGDALGYAALVSLMCDQEIDKSETQSDWSQRPLTPAQLSYAAEDVRWLIGITDELVTELKDRSRLDWVAQEIQMLVDKSSTEPGAEKVWLRLKGIGRLQESDWPLAKALCSWREETARRRDKPKSWIVKDAEILELIQRRPKDNAELSRMSGLSPGLVRYNGKKILQLIQQADEFPAPEESPAPDLTGSERKLLKLMQQVVLDYSEREGLAQRFIANKQELSQYILYHRDRYKSRSILDQGWRKEAVGEKLQALL